MKKGLILVIVLLALAGYSASHKQDPSHNQEQPTHPPAESALPTQQVKPKQETSKRQKAMEWLNMLLTWPEGVGAIAVILTFGAIVWQSSETRESARATRDSVKLQEAEMSQWVDVEPLGCYIQDPPAGKRDFPFTINLRFEAVNNTAHPFDIQKIVTKIGMMPDEWEVFTVEANATLSPQEISRKKRHAFYIPTQFITEEWFKRGTIVTINGEITFKNCLGRIQTDYFGGLYRCGQIDSSREGIFNYLEALGIVPDRAIEKTKYARQPQNPN